MMKTYYVYNHPLYGDVIQDDGFTFLGLFFTVIWLAYKKLFMIAIFTFILFIVTIIAEKVINDLTIELQAENILSKPLSELFEIQGYRKIYLSMVDREVAPWDYDDEIAYQIYDPFSSIADQKAVERSREIYEYEARLAEPVTITYSSERTKNLEVISILIWIPSIALQLFIGFKGKEWVITSLKQRGFELKQKVHACTKDAVLAEIAKSKH